MAAPAVWLDSAGVSRHHARIVVTSSDATIEDLGSKNGTSVGGKPVAAKTHLMDNDVLQIGPVSMIYHLSTAGLSTEAIPIRDHAGKPPNQR